MTPFDDGPPSSRALQASTHSSQMWLKALGTRSFTSKRGLRQKLQNAQRGVALVSDLVG